MKPIKYVHLNLFSKAPVMNLVFFIDFLTAFGDLRHLISCVRVPQIYTKEPQLYT